MKSLGDPTRELGEPSESPDSEPPHVHHVLESAPWWAQWQGQ